MLLRWMMANGHVPDLDHKDTYYISLCSRDTWDAFEEHRRRHRGIWAGWDSYGSDIVHDIWSDCLQSDLELDINLEWTAGVRAIIRYHRPAICQEIRRTVLRL